MDDCTRGDTLTIIEPFISLPERSDWTCYMFGNRPGMGGMVYMPAKGREPSRFVRWMMRICFDCLWVKESR